MSSIIDSAPAMLTAFASTVGTVIWFIATAVRRYKALDVARKQSAIPSSPQLQPPGPDVDAAVIARLRHVEAHQELSAALSRAGWAMADNERELSALRAENATLATQLKIERAGRGIANELLRAKDDRIARLEEDLARARARRLPAARELPAESEHRDAAVSGELQDAIRTPLRPGPIKAR